MALYNPAQVPKTGIGELPSGRKGIDSRVIAQGLFIEYVLLGKTGLKGSRILSWSGSPSVRRRNIRRARK